MATLNELVAICVRLAKETNPALRNVAKAAIVNQAISAPLSELALGDLCIYLYNAPAGKMGGAGKLIYADQECLQFAEDKESKLIREVKLNSAGLAVTRLFISPF